MPAPGQIRNVDLTGLRFRLIDAKEQVKALITVALAAAAVCPWPRSSYWCALQVVGRLAAQIAIILQVVTASSAHLVKCWGVLFTGAALTQ